VKYFYLSNPYNGTDEQKVERAQFAANACGRLIKDRVFTLSPIVHNHAMMKTYNDFSLEERRSIILDFDFSLLAASKGMIVLKIEGWEESYGVTKEIEFCEKKNIPVYYYTPEEIESGIATSALRSFKYRR
jgi:hypothetical protein